MQQASKWSLRQLMCPEGKGKAGLLLEWKVERGRKVLHSVCCDNPPLADYSGADCRWSCVEKIPGKRS